MADYKAMYYYLAGRMATTVETLEATTNALVTITQNLKSATLTTEEMFNAQEEEVINIIENKTDAKKSEE